MIARRTRALALRRTGYTLLEMALALAISLIILGAVYEFLNRQVTLAEMGRDLVEETKTARQILDRIAADIAANIGGTDPKQLPEITTDTTTGAIVQPSTSSAATGTATDPATDTTQTTPFLSPFNTYVEGSSNLLILSASRVPPSLAPDKRYLTPDDAVCDLRRISYWFVDDGANGGLARQELKNITSDDLSVKPPDVGEVDKLIISGHTAAYRDPCEVVGIKFEFFDGSGWQTEWNGSDLAADGITPIGPPSAIRVTLTMKNRDGQTRVFPPRTVAIPTGNNFMTQQNGF